MKIGIVVLSWNSKGFIDDCLKGLLKFEKNNIYVVDNNSEDGSGDYIAQAYPEVVLVRSIANLGFAAGNNVGIERVLRDGCEAVFLLNNDVIIDESFISGCVNILKNDSSIGIIGPVIVEFDKPNIIQCAGGSISLWNLFFPYINRGKEYRREDRFEEVGYVLGAAMLIKKEVFDKIGVFDPEYYPAYVEEADFCYRAKLSGYKCAVYYGARIRHIGAKSSGGLVNSFRRMMVNRFLFAVKHLGPAYFFFASQIIIFRVIIKKMLGR